MVISLSHIGDMSRNSCKHYLIFPDATLKKYLHTSILLPIMKEISLRPMLVSFKTYIFNCLASITGQTKIVETISIASKV